MIVSSPPPIRARHGLSPRGNQMIGEWLPSPEIRPMAELARKIIRQQWPLRNHADPLRRAQARSLIRTHVLLLRKWAETPDPAETPLRRPAPAMAL